MESSKAAQNKGGWKGQTFTKDGSLGTRLSPGKERASVRAGPAGVEAQRQAWACGPAQPSTAPTAGLAPRDGGPVGGSRANYSKKASEGSGGAGGGTRRIQGQDHRAAEAHPFSPSS